MTGSKDSKVWFITGSSRGLGRALAEAVLAAGHRVVATARKPADLADLVKQYPDRARAVALDVTKPKQAASAIAQTVDAFGRLDVVVNNAGYADTAAIEDIPLENFTAQIDTNFYGVVHVTRAALPILRKQREGRIIQISSIGGRRGGTPGLSAYQAAKFAVAGFSEVLINEVAPLGIKVTIVEPGGFATDWAGPSMKILPVSFDYEQTVGATTKRFASTSSARGDPKRAAQALIQLASMDAPPRRLLLGTDAFTLARVSDQEKIAEADQHRALTASTDADGLTDFAETDVGKMMLRKS